MALHGGGRPLDRDKYSLARVELHDSGLVTIERGAAEALYLCTCMSDGFEEETQSVKLEVGHFLAAFQHSTRPLVRAVLADVSSVYFSGGW